MIFDIGKVKNHMNYSKGAEVLARDLLEWSKCNLSKEVWKKKYPQFLEWLVEVGK